MPKTLRIGGRVLHALNDGVVLPPPRYFQPSSAFDRLVDENGEIRSPIGAFLWPGERNVLIDAGLGPVSYANGLMVGGDLLTELAAVGMATEDIDILALSHLHADHAGWLASPTGEPTFPNATVVIGRDDWQHFLVDHPDQLADNLSAALTTLLELGRVNLVERERDIAAGVRLVPAPGHTPGHSVFVLEDDRERLMLLGDSVFCPLQLTETDLGTLSDLDAVTARRTRDSLAQEMERHELRAVGCHFPGLTAGRLLGGQWVGEPG